MPASIPEITVYGRRPSWGLGSWYLGSRQAGVTSGVITSQDIDRDYDLQDIEDMIREHAKPTLRRFLTVLQRSKLLKLTPYAIVASLVIEVTLITAIKYMEGVEQKTAQDAAILAELNRQYAVSIGESISNTTILDLAGLLLEDSTTSDALSLLPLAPGLAGSPALEYDPAVPPISAHIEEVTVTAYRPGINSLTLDISIPDMTAPDVIGTTSPFTLPSATIPKTTTIPISGAVPTSGTQEILAGAVPSNPGVDAILDLVKTLPASALDTVLPIDVSAVPVSVPVDTLDWIPPVAITTGPAVISASPAALGERIGLSTNIATRATSQTALEQNTLRNEVKPKGLWYLVALRFINRSWGKLIELDDWYQVFKNNIILPNMRVCLSTGQCIRVKDGTTLGALPLRYEKVIIAAMIKSDPMLMDRILLDQQGYMTDFFMMELQDMLIGISMRSERNIINNLGLRGPFDYGNASTWSRRIGGLLNEKER